MNLRLELLKQRENSFDFHYEISDLICELLHLRIAEVRNLNFSRKCDPFNHLIS